MRLVLRGLAIAVVAAVALAAAVAAFGHTSRGATSPAVSVAPGLVAEKGGGVWLYAARVPGGVVLFDAGLDPDGGPVDVALSALGSTRDEVTDVFLSRRLADVPVSRICTSRSRCTPEGSAKALLAEFAAEHR